MRHVIIITDCTDVAYSEIRAKIISETKSKDYMIEPLVGVYPLSIINAAFMVRLLIDDYPKNSIFLLLCSPERELHERVVVRTKNGSTIIAGNNGTLSLLLEESMVVSAVTIPRRTISTFGGLEVYAKYVSLLLDSNPEEMLENLPDVKVIAIKQLKTLGTLESKVLHIDNLGLVKVNGKNDNFEIGDFVSIEIDNKPPVIGVYSRRFVELDTGTPTIYRGSSLGGLTEVAIVRKNSAKLLNIEIGNSIRFKKIADRIRAIFFDYSGTLVKRNPDLKFDLKTFIHKSGIKMPVVEFTKIFDKEFLQKKVRNLDEVVDKLKEVVDPADSDYFVTEERKFLSDLVSGISLLDGAKEVLSELSKTYSLGIISNTDSFSYSYIKSASIGKLFKFELPSFRTGLLKPDIEAFRKILSVTNLKPYEILVIGNDEKKDLEPARSLGMFTILFTDFEDLKYRLPLYGVKT